MKESSVLKRVWVEASKQGYKLFRNQVGLYKLADGRVIRSGLCVGSSDLIGWKKVRIMQDMVGMDICQFAAIECKSEKGRLSPEQEKFLHAVLLAGGIGKVVKSVDDL
jgi:hypothetical protein